MSNLISSEELKVSNDSFLELMEIKRKQIDNMTFYHNMKAQLIDSLNIDKSDENATKLKTFAKTILKEDYNYDVDNKSQEDDEYIYNASDHYDEVSNFGRLCYSILYIFIRNAIIQTRGILARLQKNTKNYMKFNIRIKLNENINYYQSISKKEKELGISYPIINWYIKPKI